MDRLARFSALIFSVLLMFLFSLQALSQSTTGVIFGDVKDSSGAVLPGVEITVLNLATNQSRTAITNESGAYNVPLVPIGKYNVSASLPSFKTQIRSGIEIQVDQRAKIDFTLAVGELSEKVL